MLEEDVMSGGKSKAKMRAKILIRHVFVVVFVDAFEIKIDSLLQNCLNKPSN